MSPKDLKILRLLMDNPKGLYGSEIVALSDGFLKRGSIYSLLDRLVEKGYVKEIQEPPTPSLQLARTRHKISGVGERAVREYAKEMGFSILSTAEMGA